MQNKQKLDLIDRDWLSAECVRVILDPQEALDFLLARIKNAKPIDAVPIVHGRWSLVSKGNFSPGGLEIEEKCSECGRYVYRYEDQPQDNYCPNCGAKLDAKEAEHGQES